MQLATGQGKPAAKARTQAGAGAAASAAAALPRPLPIEVRGVHVTAALASLPGKLDEYVGYTKHGLNTIELDVKDEGGEIGFVPSAVPLAIAAGAGRSTIARAKRRGSPTVATCT